MVTVRALSVRQPWAWAIIHAGKDIENRSWAPWRGYRGLLVILASTGMSRDEYEWACDDIDRIAIRLKRPITVPEPGDLPRGGVVGVVDLHDVAPPGKPASRWHFSDQYGWQLRKPQALAFRRYRGGQGLRRFEPSSAEQAAIRAYYRPEHPDPLTATPAPGTPSACRNGP